MVRNESIYENEAPYVERVNSLFRHDNGPFDICVLSCLAFEWKRGWSWLCFGKKTPAFFYVYNAVFTLSSRNLYKKGSEVSIGTRSTPGLLWFKGQATKHTSVKWSIGPFLRPPSLYFKASLSTNVLCQLFELSIQYACTLCFTI